MRSGESGDSCCWRCPGSWLEVQDGRHHSVDIAKTKVWTHGQAENVVGYLGCEGKCLGGESRAAIGLLSVGRYRVVNQRADIGIGKMTLQCIPAPMPDCVQMPGWCGPIRHKGQHQVAACQAGCVMPGNGATAFVPVIEMTELYPQHRGLYRIEAAVEALDLVHIFFPGAVVAQHTDAVGNVVPLGGDCAAIAEGAKILAGIKTPGHRIAVATNGFALVAGAMGLG